MMNPALSKLKIFLISCVIYLGLFSIPSVFAQDAWPSRPVKLIIPFPAGGASDILGRVLAQTLSAEIGQSVVVDNKLGAAGAIGSEFVARANPDGYTLLLATSSTHSILPYLSTKITYDPILDFTPISGVAEGGSLLVVNTQLPVNNLLQLITYAKQNPGAVNYASSGIGSIPHLMGAYFAGLAGVQLQHIPYKGSSLSYPDLKTGQVQILFDSIVTAYPQVKSGNVKALAITSSKRSQQAPEIPTMAEAGLPTYITMTWFGILGPKAMDPRLTSRIALAIQKALKDPQLINRYRELGMEVSQQKQEEFSKTIAAESEKWKKVIIEQKITVE